MSDFITKFYNCTWVQWTMNVMNNIGTYDLDKIESWLTILAGFISAIVLLIVIVFMILVSMFGWMLCKAVMVICDVIIDLCS